MGQSSGEVIAITIVFTVLELSFSGLRLWARRITRVKGGGMGIDDALAFLAAFLFIPCLAVPIIIESADANLGNHIQKSPDGKPMPLSYLFRVMDQIFEATHVIPISLAKCSLLFFYKRIFRGSVFSYITWTTIGLAIIWGVSFFFVLLFYCVPITSYIRYGFQAPGLHCIDPYSVYYSLTISDFLIDIIILIIPIPFVWRLHMKPSQKIGVSAIFALGSLTIAASITRMVKFIQTLHHLDEVIMDPTFYQAPASYWVVIEASLAITSACLPTIRPVFRGMSPESVIRSIRSVLSLSSLRSNSSKRNGFDNLQDRDRRDSGSSRVGLHEGHFPLEKLSMKSQVTHPGVMKDMGPIPKDGMMVQKSFTMAEDTV